MDDDHRFARRLWGFYAAARAHFEYADPWWPGTPLQIAATAILVQQCDWSHAWNAIQHVDEAGLLTIPRLATANENALAATMYPLRFSVQKAKRLKGLALAVSESGVDNIEAFLARDDDTGILRERLLATDGIGPETADCILLFAGKRPSFVIDACTRRVFERLDLFPELGNEFWTRPYDELKAFFETQLLADLSLYDSLLFAADVPREIALFRDFHAQILELAKHHCLKSKPRCHARGKPGWNGYSICDHHCQSSQCGHCPLVDSCVFGPESAE